MNRSEAGKRGYEKTARQLEENRNRQHRTAVDRYEDNPKRCLFCGEWLPYEKRWNTFCNQSCSASHNNQGKTRHIKRSRLCNCGKPKKLKNKYCADCANNRVYNKVISLDKANNDKIRKRILLEQREHKCQVCGFETWNGMPITLELDHVDGDADNNTEENLRLICPNCHSQTATYKGANAGKNSSRQIMRRKRYADGKTY